MNFQKVVLVKMVKFGYDFDSTWTKICVKFSKNTVYRNDRIC